MTRYAGLLLLLFFFTPLLFAQPDSLYLAEGIRKARSLAYANPDSAELILGELLRFSTENENKWGLMATHATLGIIKFNQRDAEGSYQHLMTALPLAEALRDERMRASILNNLGNYHLVMSNLDSALSLYLASAKIEEEIGEPNVATSYLNIALVYLNTQNYTKTEEFLFKALRSPARMPEQRSLHAYVNLANLKLKEKDYAKSLFYADSALVFGRKLGVGESIGRVASIQAQCWFAMGEPKKALVRVDTALNYLRQAGGKPFFEAQVDKARILNALNRPAQAATVMQATLPQLGKFANIRQLALQALAQSYEAQGKDKESLQTYKAYQQLYDSLTEVKRKQELERQLVEYETREKESEIQRLEQESRLKDLELERNRYVLLGLSAVSLLLLLVGFLVFRQKRLQATQRALEAQLRWRRAQLNPHFFFNLLTAVRTLILEGQAQKAGKSLSRFARLMRQTLEGSNQDWISLEEEVQFLEDYLALARLQFNFEMKIEYLPTDLEPEEFFVPSMLLQPFVENAIEHGIGKSSRRDKRLEILFEEKNEQLLHITLRDNGVGRTRTASDSPQHRSRATQITQERQQLMKNRFTFTILDLKDQNGKPAGTEVRFEVQQ